KAGTNRWFGDLETMFGIPGESHSAEVGEFYRRVHPDDLERVSQTIENAKQNREPYFAEFRVQKEDGAIRWVIARGKFYYDGNGEPERMLGLALDITDRRLAQEKLQESEARFRLVANTAPVMIWMSGTDKLRTYVNQPWLDLTGRNFAAEMENGWVE